MKNYTPDDDPVPEVGKSVIDSHVRYSKKDKKWFRNTRFSDGSKEVVEVDKLKHLDPEEYKDNEGDDIVDLEPFSIFIEVEA